ncbi:uncharacterized protein N7496_011045 [Penicillium cataractarum]|uniref:Uncharacterized protein n=1 Tax=Penicillium cataractarum TaxID=2100454 RepID=A0A9W9UV80_9EURO|nr:uncharacterized protein N7496_011045 [Penicillium cataractarum]KAJ5358632.1 hypothetical protein N7496_011045 [Penicillium cataractarum]
MTNHTVRHTGRLPKVPLWLVPAWTAGSQAARVPSRGHLLVLLEAHIQSPSNRSGCLATLPFVNVARPSGCVISFHPFTLSPPTRVRFESLGATLLNTSSLRSTIAPVADNGTPR